MCCCCFAPSLGFKGATREGAKGAEAPPLDNSKLTNKIKYRTVLMFFCVSVIWSCVIWPIHGFKNWIWHGISSNSTKIHHQNDVTKFFHFQALPLVKSWLRSCLACVILFELNRQFSILPCLVISKANFNSLLCEDDCKRQIERQLVSVDLLLTGKHEGRSGVQGSRGPLDFHTWYWWSRVRLNVAIFRTCFFRCPPPWKNFLPTPLVANSLVRLNYDCEYAVYQSWSCEIINRWQLTQRPC